MALAIELVPCLDDNYAVILHDDSATILVDAPDAAPIEARLKTRGWMLTHILITHHHHDHVAGVGALKNLYGARVFANGADSHRIDGVTDWVKAGGRISIGSMSFEIIDTPGHTLGHVAYYCPDHEVLFAGDSLFAGGCGRIFEGEAGDFHKALQQLAALPAHTRLYCGHEYTVSNLRFGLSEEPDNAGLAARLREVEALRQHNKPSLPSTIGLERETNVFLRARDAEAFAERRARKDRA